MIFPDINPVAVSLGPVSIHWYGIMYVLSFMVARWLMLRRSCQSWSPVTAKQVEDVIFYGALGVVLGGRFGYALFYQFDRVLQEPLWLFKVWDGGMSFHGGLIGVILAMLILCRRYKVKPLAMGDFIAPMVPVGLFFGRIGNLIGQELWGRPTDGWWAVIFFKDTASLPRHPSQIYEAALEGVVLFMVLWWLSKVQRSTGLICGVFIGLYGVFRFLIEFAREPDAHLINNLAFEWMTRGQLLCIPMIIIGGILVARARKQKT